MKPRRFRWKQRRWDSARFRLLRAAIFILSYDLVVVLRDWVFPSGRVPVLWWERLLQLMSWCWIAAVPAVAVGAISLAMPAMRRPTSAGSRREHLVCFRVVSRGRNADALAETVGAIRASMQARPLFPYRIEVVTDEPVDLPAGRDLGAFVVPRDYTTPAGSLYKARALHYLTEVSPLRDDAWIFHCDEESQLTPGLVGGIRDAVTEEEERAERGLTPRVGQGTILYYRSLEKHPVLTLADMIRTGDDVTRFRTQFRSGALFCGMHGSFILVRADVERSVSFDVGPEGSITEDAWWAFSQAFGGREFRWVDGYLLEQSPEHWKDFAKQRRRWFSGLWKVCLYAPAPPLARAALMVFLTSWVVSALGGLYTLINLVTGFTTPAIPKFLGTVVFAWYISAYLTGLWLNIRTMPEATRPGPLRQAGLYAAQVVLLPVFGTLEAAGVVYALIRPERGFHVVRKSAHSAPVAPTPEAAPIPEPLPTPVPVPSPRRPEAPVSRSALGSAVAVAAPTGSGAEPLVLVVEDDGEVRSLLARRLRSEGFRVLVAADGETGLRLALSRRPDVTVVDVTLPGMSGIELCRELRAGEGTASIPVVLVTGRSAEAEVRDGLAAGADDYVVKPFRTGDLVARIMALLPLPAVDPSAAPA